VVIKPMIIYADSYAEAWEQAKVVIQEAAYDKANLNDYFDVQIIKNVQRRGVLDE